MDATSDAPRSPSDALESAAPLDGSGASASPTPHPPRIVCWTPGGTTETGDLGELPGMLENPEANLWVDLIDPPPEVVSTVTKMLGIHPLIAEDIGERNQRAKVETFDDVIHVVLFDLDYRGEVQPEEIDLVLGHHFLLSVHGPDPDLVKHVESRNPVGHFLAKGADFLMYAIADHVVDGYFPVLDRLADEIDELQDRVIGDPSEWTLQRLFVLKRELIAIRRATSPAREVLNQVTNRELEVIRPDHLVYFRDVYDHLIRVTDELDNYRDLVSGTVEIYLSTVNNNLSTIMKRLTGVTVILAGIGAVAGIFGMSEAALALGRGEGNGFWIITGIIVGAAAIAAVILRRIGWI